ncbi:pheromone receptor Rcb2 B43 [Mycena vitilis]|nr:pheromone receptor Rcb2 B43 [Mycena vitilis]
MRPEFAPIAFISAFSLLLPLPWHWRARNVATLSIMLWLFVTNMIYAIDALIWAGNVNIVATVWCDITTKLIVGSNFALPAACLCICMHLEQVASVRMARTTAADKRRRQIFELAMCFGLPIVYMALHFVVQGHRFDIMEDYGCRPTVYFSIASIFLLTLPPILLSVASLVYGGIALRHFINRRISFAAHLDSSHSALTTSRYFRLMLMSMLEMIWSISVTSYTLWFTTISIPIRPYTSWADVHSNFSRIDTFVTFLLPQNIITAYYFLWWLVPISTLAFVAMFAFGRDAVEEYTRCLVVVRNLVFRRTPGSAQAKENPFGTLKDTGAARTAIELPSFDPKRKPSATSSFASPASPSSKFREALEDHEYDSASEYGSTPSSQFTFVPAPRPAQTSPPRPVTYPSFDASHRGIPPSSAV